MKFFEKVRDLFTDDEEELVEVNDDEIIKKEVLEEEHQLPTFMRNKLAEEKKNEEKKDDTPDFLLRNSNEDVSIDKDFLQTRSGKRFSFPVDVDDSNHFDDKESSNIYYETGNDTLLSHNNDDRNYDIKDYQNGDVREKDFYGNPKDKKPVLYPPKKDEKPRRFKPTPVISPVYGILDKNYTKDDVKVTDSNSYEIQRPSRKVDFETVRNKAFGNVNTDVQDNLCKSCEIYQEVKITKAVELKEEDDKELLSDIRESDLSKDISVADAEENYYDYGVDYVPPKRRTPNIEDIEDVKIINHNNEESVAEKIEVKDSLIEDLNITDKLSDTKEFDKMLSEEETSEMILNNLSDVNNEKNENNDIFNLIDSMYEEDEK